MRIRKAKQRDMEDIALVAKSLDFKEFKISSPENIKKKMKRGEWYVVEENGQVRAVMILEYSEKSCEVNMVASTTKGGGRALINYAVKLCQQKKIPKLWCWSLAEYKAEKFYKKMGFEEIFS